MNKKTYTGSKIQNHFTAYLIQFVRGKRHDYLEKKIQMADAEELLEDIGQMEARIVIEELLENQTREQLLLQEAQGKYPEWNKMWAISFNHSQGSNILWEFFVIFVALFGFGTYRNRKETYPKMYTF